ncbi:MAG: hypothetical protein WKF59_24765 [Chitinophagaceae bacterium]
MGIKPLAGVDILLPPALFFLAHIFLLTTPFSVYEKYTKRCIAPAFYVLNLCVSVFKIHPYQHNYSGHYGVQTGRISRTGKRNSRLSAERLFIENSLTKNGFKPQTSCSTYQQYED